MTIIDAHQHFWDLNKVDYPWITPDLGPLNRTFIETELEPQLDEAGVDRTVLVQAANSTADTDFMIDLADRWPRVAGIVGWVPLLDPQQAAEELDRRRRNPQFVGVRHLIHDEADPDWVVRPEVLESLAIVAGRELTFDVVAVLPRHLEHVVTIAERLPQLRLIIDHLAKPPIKDVGWEPWSSLLALAAEHSNVSAKISGLTTAADPANWTTAALQPYVDRALELFGPHRLMMGGDWPVSILSGRYADVWRESGNTLAGLDEPDRGEVFGGTAAAIYRLDL